MNFDFAPYESLRCEMIELGRACVHAEHRTFNLLHLLWRGIAIYAIERKARFLVVCSSLTSQDPAEGAAMYEQLQSHLVEPALRTYPHPEFAVVSGIGDLGLERDDAKGRLRSPPPATTICGASSSYCAHILRSAQKSAGRLQSIKSSAQSISSPCSISARFPQSCARIFSDEGRSTDILKEGRFLKRPAAVWKPPLLSVLPSG